ncbi:ribonuclease H-like domain-containing protein [Tanacetum coccineum]
MIGSMSLMQSTCTLDKMDLEDFDLSNKADDMHQYLLAVMANKLRESLEVYAFKLERMKYAWGVKYEQMEYDLKDKRFETRRKQKELDPSLKRTRCFKVILENMDQIASVLQKRLVHYKQRYVSDKSCIGFGIESSNSMESDISSGDETLTDSTYENFKREKAYKAVPPPTGTIIPPRANVSFTGIDELAIRNKVVNQEKTKSSQSAIDRNKVIIEDWVDSDDEETDVSESQKETAFNSENSETSFENRSPNSQNSVGQESRTKGLGNKGGKLCFEKDKLSDFKEFKGGYVAFGNDSKGGRISGKGTIKTSCLDFEKVSYVEELKFNLLSFVDEDLVILRAPRKNDVYSLDLKNIIPSGGITCLVAKATEDEAVLWHRRLGHVNFKNINKCDHGSEFKFNLCMSFVAKKGNQERILAVPGIQQQICKGFRVYNRITRKVQDCLHVNFLENQENQKGKGPDWMFDLDLLNPSMKYIPQFIVHTTQPMPPEESTAAKRRKEEKEISIAKGNETGCTVLSLYGTQEGLQALADERWVDSVAKKNCFNSATRGCIVMQGMLKALQLIVLVDSQRCDHSQSAALFQQKLGDSRSKLFLKLNKYSSSKKTKLKKLSKFVQPVVKHHAFWVESQHLKKQKRRRKKQKKKVSSVKLGRNKEEGTLSEEHYVQDDYTADPFFEDIVDKDAAVTPDLERKSDETEEINIEEKKASDVKSGDTEELDLEAVQSTARQSTITPRTLNFNDEAGPSSPIRPTQNIEPEEQFKVDEVLADISRPRGLSIPGPIQSQPQPQQPSQATDPKDKGKGILVEEPKKKKLTLQQIRALETTNDEEVARKIQAEWDAEEERKRFEELKKAKPKTTLRKPTSLAQERNQMMNFLKGQGYKNLQKLKYPQMKELYDKVQESIKDSFKDFIPMDSEREKQMLKERDEKRLLRKRKATISEEQPSKKVKLRTETVDELRNYLRIVDFEKNAQDRESLEGISMITELQVIDSPDGEYLIIHRANNHFRAFDTLWEILHILDRQDLYHLYRVVQDYYEHIPPTGLGLILLGDLTIIWETAETSDDDFWKDQEEWEIIRWRFHESSGVHTLELEDGTMIHMLAERRYPLSRELMIRMLDHGMEVEDENETAITLIHLFILWTTEDGDNS